MKDAVPTGQIYQEDHVALSCGHMGKLDVMGVAEIAVRLGVSRSRAAQIVRERHFPEPAAVLTGIVIWETADVEAWIAKRRPPKDGGDEV